MVSSDRKNGKLKILASNGGATLYFSLFQLSLGIADIIPGDYVHWGTSDYFEMQKKETQENQEKIKALRSRLERQLYFMIPEESKNWCNPHTILLAGEPYKELIKYAKEQDIDMIVLGIRGHTLLEKLLVGSTTDRVIRQSPCPVLAVRPMDEHIE